MYRHIPISEKLGENSIKIDILRQIFGKGEIHLQGLSDTLRFMKVVKEYKPWFISALLDPSRENPNFLNHQKKP